ncbi:L-fucose/L-arabinose isomerase family protein [Planctomycetota bacterium]
MNKTTFALYFGNRGFFPETLIAGARREMVEELEKLGYGTLIMDENATPHGAVESPEEGAKYARFLEANREKYDGVILCLPNFGDETGAICALRDAGVPIMIQAYPDEPDKMGFSTRRDAFCGKFSVMDVFYQYGLPFTTFKPHTIHPAGDAFAQQVGWFAAVCRVVNGMKRMIVGAIGARTTAFKTVRFDELTLQRYGITTETLDLSEVMSRVRDQKADGDTYHARAERLKNYTRWDGVPDEAFVTLTKLSVVLDEIIAEHDMDAMALRCWLELEKELKVSPCVLLSELNDRGIPAACELDVCNAVAMHSLSLASGRAATCLDWNNNYGVDDDKCILFHCGPVPQSLMTRKGTIIEHPMFAKALGAGCAYGCNAGRIAAAPLTFASSKTQDGKLTFYLGEGEFTQDEIADDFFGCAGVARIDKLQDKLEIIGHQGYRHHVGVTTGHVAVPVREAWERYLNYSLESL